MPFSGKTSNYRCLAAALSLLSDQGSEEHVRVGTPCLNPKSVPPGRLYGEFDAVSHEWTDGILAIIYRTCAQDTSGERRWMVFDGPVDALWIENMNTVLDDNKMLCLSNGERIKLAAGMHMMFEVNDLSVASPATVSRCGMVYMEAVYIGNRPLLLSWLEHVLPKRLPAAAAHKHLLGLFDKFLEPAIAHVRESGKEGIASVDGNLISNLLKMLDAVLQPAFGVRAVDAEGNVDMKLVNLWFVFCFTWTLGGNLREESRVEFDAWVRESGMLADLAPDFPPNLTIFEVCVSHGDVTAFVPWTDIMNKYTYSKEEPYFNILVPTGETTCYNWLLQTLVGAGQHTMIIGETGTGKSVTVQALSLIHI